MRLIDFLKPKRGRSFDSAPFNHRHRASRNRGMAPEPSASARKSWPAGFGSGLSTPLLAISTLACPLTAIAQVTTLIDSGAGSLRSAVDASATDDTISVQIAPATIPPAEIVLNNTLVFDNSVTIDNSDTTFGTVTILPPSTGNFIEIQNNVNLILKDVGLSGAAANAIVLQGAGSELTINAIREAPVVSAPITGPGTLHTEAASLSLNGDMTNFTGTFDILPSTFTISAVTLKPDALPAGDYTFDTVLDGAFSGLTVDTTNANSITLAGDISGGGSFTKNGAGTLTLTGAASHTGGTDVSGGELIGNTSNLQGTIRVVAGSTLGFDQAQTMDGIFSGQILSGTTGQITIRKLGLGSLTFANDQTFDAIINVEAGKLIGTTGNLLGDINVSGGASLYFDQSSDGTFAGTLSSPSGSIDVRKLGTGALTFNTAQTFTGDISVEAGSLVLDASQNIAGNMIVDGGSLLLNSNQSSIGGLNVNGGSLFLNSSQSFTGDLNLNGGIVNVNADQAFTGSFNANAGSVHFFGGSDLTNASLTVGSGGGTATTTTLTSTFDPTLGADNTVKIGGNLMIHSDAQVTVDVDDNTDQSTVFDVTGNVTIDPNAELVVRLQPGAYNTMPTFDIIKGAVTTGSDFDIQQGNYFFNIVGTNTTTAYQLSIAPSGNMLSGVATSSNQIAVAGPLDALRSASAASDPSLLAFQSALNAIQTSEIGGLLESASADDLAASTNVQLAAATRTWRGLSNRLSLQRRRSIGHHGARAERLERARRERAERLRSPGRRRRRPSVDAGPASVSLPARENKPWVAWIDGRGELGTLDSNSSKGYDYQLVGPMIGADSALTSEFRVGFGVGSSHSRYDTTGQTDNQGVSHSAEGLVYAAWTGAPLEVLVGARYAHTWVETNRHFKFSSISDRIQGKFQGNQLGAYVELTRGFALPAQLEIAPLLSLAYTHLMWGSFSEAGTSALRMRVKESRLDSAITSLGFRLSGKWEMEDGLLITPRFKALWDHEWADTNRKLSGSFAAAPASAANNLTLQGAEVPNDFAEVGLGWEVGYRRNANLFIDWDGRFGEDLIANSVSVGVRVAW